MDRRERSCTEEELARAAFDSLQAGLWTAMPGIIDSFDPSKMTADVQIAVMGRQRGSDGKITYTPITLLVDCPVLFNGGGGFTLTFPIAPGDECLVVFADRCIDSWWQSGGVQKPIELRMHDLSDGFVIPGFRSVPRVLSGISATSTQLRSDDGETFVEVAAGVVNVTAPTAINLTAPEINMNASTKITLNTPQAELSGTFTVDNTGGSADPVTINGTIQVTGDVLAGTVSLKNHIHNAPGGNTSAPL